MGGARPGQGGEGAKRPDREAVLRSEQVGPKGGGGGPSPPVGKAPALRSWENQPRSGKKRRQTVVFKKTVAGHFWVGTGLVQPVPTFDNGLRGLVLFGFKVQSGDSKHIVEILVIEVAPVHRIGEKIDQVRVLIIRI